MRSVDSSEVSFLILILNYSYARCSFWGKLGEECMGLLGTIFATSCEFIIISPTPNPPKKKEKEVRESTDAWRAHSVGEGQA